MSDQDRIAKLEETVRLLTAENHVLRELKLPHFLKLSDEMRADGDRAHDRAKEDGCYSVPVLNAVFFEAAIQRWLNDQDELIEEQAKGRVALADDREKFEETVESLYGFRSTQLCLLDGTDFWKVWQAALRS